MTALKDIESLQENTIVEEPTQKTMEPIVKSKKQRY